MYLKMSSEDRRPFCLGLNVSTSTGLDMRLVPNMCQAIIYISDHPFVDTLMDYKSRAS